MTRGLVLLTGGAGYVGSALLPRLLESGWRVRLLDVLLWGTEPVKPWLNHPDLELIQADFRDEQAVSLALQDAAAVVHLGGVVGDPAGDLAPELTVDVNVTATRALAELARERGVKRFLFASSGAVYGACDRWMDEDSPLNPVSLYARSKIAGERILQGMAGEDFSPVILRFGTIFGFSGRARFDLVVNLLTAKALVEGQITVYGGDQWRTFVHVDDAAAALFAALTAPADQVHGRVFNVGSAAETCTIRQVGERIHQHVPGAELVVTPAVEASDYRIDCGRIERELGYRARWTLDEGIRQVRTAVDSGAVRDYQDERYSNVRFMAGSGRDMLSPRIVDQRWAWELVERVSAEGHGCDGQTVADEHSKRA